MRQQKRNPAAREADRAPKLLILADSVSENRPSALALQVAFISRRVGLIDPATLATLAGLAFGEVAR